MSDKICLKQETFDRLLSLAISNCHSGSQPVHQSEPKFVLVEEKYMYENWDLIIPDRDPKPKVTIKNLTGQLIYIDFPNIDLRKYFTIISKNNDALTNYNLDTVQINNNDTVIMTYKEKMEKIHILPVKIYATNYVSNMPTNYVSDMPSSGKIELFKPPYDKRYLIKDKYNQQFNPYK